MGYDKVVDSTALDNGITQIADKIREKTKKSETLNFPDDFVTELSNPNLVDTSDANLGGLFLAERFSGYAKGEKVDGLLTKYEGSSYLTPTKEGIKLGGNFYSHASIEVVDEPNFIPENVKAGVRLWNLTGTYEGSGTGGGGTATQDLELVESEGGVAPKFTKTNGTVEIWGWGEGAKSGYTTPHYLFEGKTYRELAYGVQPPVTMNLSISTDGTVTGYPQLVDGKFLVVRKG